MLDYINENLLSHGIAIEGLKYIPQEEPRDYLLGIIPYHKGKRWLPCLFFGRVSCPKHRKERPFQL